MRIFHYVKTQVAQTILEAAVIVIKRVVQRRSAGIPSAIPGKRKA
jgi:hypothetical protein